MKYKEAHTLITNCYFTLDMVLNEFGITHQDYRKEYPETPISPGLALDIIYAQEIGVTRARMKKEWSLTDSQLNYALYNDNAVISYVDPLALMKTKIAKDLKRGLSQTDVAEEYGVSQPYVHNIAKSLHLLKDRKHRVVLTDEQVEHARNSKESVASLAKRFGVTRDALYKRLRNSDE